MTYRDTKDRLGMIEDHLDLGFPMKCAHCDEVLYFPRLADDIRFLLDLIDKEITDD